METDEIPVNENWVLVGGAVCPLIDTCSMKEAICGGKLLRTVMASISSGNPLNKPMPCKRVARVQTTYIYENGHPVRTISEMAVVFEVAAS